jgi:hypothetical protein
MTPGRASAGRDRRWRLACGPRSFVARRTGVRWGWGTIALSPLKKPIHNKQFGDLKKTLYTVICFFSIAAKFGSCPIVGLNGSRVEAKIRKFKCPKCVFSPSTSVPFRPKTVQMPISTNWDETDYSVDLDWTWPKLVKSSNVFFVNFYPLQEFTTQATWHFLFQLILVNFVSKLPMD